MKRDDNKPVAESGPQTDQLIVVFKTLGDTTWRMFGPVIIGALIGYWTGGKNAPAIGAIIGLAAAGILVWRQYVSVTKENSP